jgi:sugar phosphate permease
MFYLFYFFNALGYVCGGPLPCQVLVSRWFDRARGRAMGIAYLGIGIGGAVVPLLAKALTDRFGWRGSLEALGALIVVVALPFAWFVKEDPEGAARLNRLRQGYGGQEGSRYDRTVAGASASVMPSVGDILTRPAFYLLAIGSMCSIAAVGGANQHLKLFLSLDRSYSQADAARVISLVLTVSIAGRLLM